jgi:diguanylate cyclase (GGDEF)-like protein/PAS domain S-box-containing protein
MRRQLVFGIIGGLVAVLYLSGALDFVERHLHDFRSGILSRQASGEIVLVTIDHKSLQRLRRWPWPREDYATVIERLVDAGASKIALAIDFSTPSDVQNDRRLAAALAHAGPDRVALPVFRQLGSDADESQHVVEPLPLFRQHSALASADVWPDQDALVRRFDVHQDVRGAAIPTVPGWLLNEPQHRGEGNLIDFSIEPSTIPRISFVDVLKGTFDPSRVAGKRVLIGATTVELGDEVSVPRHQLLPGIVLQALVAETLLQQRAIRSVAGWPIALLGALIALAVGRLMSRREWLQGTVIAIAAAVLVICIAIVFQLIGAISLHTSPILLDIVLSALAAQLDRQVSMISAQRLALRHKDAVMGRLVDDVFDGIVTFDDQGKVLSWNRAAERMFGDSIEQVSGKPLEALLPLLSHSYAAQGTLAPRELLAKRSDGSHFPVEVAVSATEMEGVRMGAAVVRDITKRKVDEELARQALHDSLTGLPNRAFLLNRIEEMTLDVERSGGSFALLILDLDGFKHVNDRLGHRVGDLVLRDLAPRLQEPLRGGDVVARLGGDEFALLLSPPADAKSAFAVAGRIIHCVRQPLLVEGMCFRLSASIGIALHPQHGRKASHLLHYADTAMYTAKRDRLVIALYSPDFGSPMGKDFVLREELDRAIKQGDLVLHYQPKFDVRTLQLVGLEALVRWQHPDHGLLSPDKFIPLAEYTDLIQPLTDWVLNAAIRQQRLWLESGYNIVVAVNLSAKSLRDPQLVNRFRTICERCSVSPDRTIFEITESSVISDPKSASRVLNRLAKMGCKVSLDDFGTGYSSLFHLQNLPISELKIDRSFVGSMSTDQNASTIVRTIVNLAHTLGMKVVAEGVEDRATFTRLTVIGCDQIQGYLFGRPLAARDLEKSLRESSRTIDSSDPTDRRETRLAALLAARVGSLRRASVAELAGVSEKPTAASGSGALPRRAMLRRRG